METKDIAPDAAPRNFTVETDMDAAVSRTLGIQASQARETRLLLAEGASVPFIARYRKEKTGSLDEVAISAIRDLVAQHQALNDRKAFVLQTIFDQGKLTAELEAKIRNAETLALVEDMYLPFKQKRKTKASVAREKGLAPLADLIFSQTGNDPATLAAAYVNEEKGVGTPEEALEGARHIMAETINENADIRKVMRTFFSSRAMIDSRVISGKEAEGQKFKDYFEWSDKASDIPSHRLLAIRRGESEGILSVSVRPSEDSALDHLLPLVVSSSGPDGEQVRTAATDAYRRLLSRALETELRMEIKKTADQVAIEVFADNLMHLLMASPLGAMRILAIDPGLRTGCKMVCLDGKGDLLHTETIFPHSGEGRRKEAEKAVRKLLQAFSVEAVAIGNGTAGRETEAFVREITGSSLPVILVNESGASIYSASEIAREEFPDQDITVRGAVSIGRRLMDPLAELVKIDPKSIGVGQYQHDVDQAQLKQALDDVVIRCVNQVGVNVNTASPTLLSYVSGLGPRLAKNIVSFREEHGAFPSRTHLKKVPRLGPKAFEQAAGFLRIQNPENPLDGSAVHPEHYPVVEAMAKDAGCQVKALMSDSAYRKKIDIRKYVTEAVGIPTLTDILAELEKPGRDPREPFTTTRFAEGVHDIRDLTEGMRLPGVVTNVTAFGAFVDIGVHQDGLVHISQLADHFVKNPHDVVSVGQQVQVRVVSVEPDRRRIALTMRSGEPGSSGRPAKKRQEKKQPFHNPMAQALARAKQKS